MHRAICGLLPHAREFSVRLMSAPGAGGIDPDTGRPGDQDVVSYRVARLTHQYRLSPPETRPGQGQEHRRGNNQRRQRRIDGSATAVTGREQAAAVAVTAAIRGRDRRVLVGSKGRPAWAPYKCDSTLSCICSAAESTRRVGVDLTTRRSVLTTSH